MRRPHYPTVTTQGTALGGQEFGEDDASSVQKNVGTNVGNGNSLIVQVFKHRSDDQEGHCRVIHGYKGEKFSSADYSLDEKCIRPEGENCIKPGQLISEKELREYEGELIWREVLICPYRSSQN